MRCDQIEFMLMINVLRDSCLVTAARGFRAAWFSLLVAGALGPNLASAAEAPAGGPGLTPRQLRCEYLVNPLGIDEAHPRLSWIVESNQRGQRQTACQVLVASDDALLRKDRGNLWDSGKMASDQTTGIVYGGKALASQQHCYWKIKVWDKDGKASAWSEPATWGMGLLKARDWKAQYISFRDTTPVHRFAQPLFLPPARQFRKEFAAGKAVRRATIYGTALGIYELHLNGQRVGDACFAPGWSDYHQRAYYNTYDVTALVKQGNNALGAWVADGWYSGYIGFGLLTTIGTEAIGRYTYGKTPALMAQLEIEYTDGSRQRIVTDTSWKVTGSGPIQEADFLMGERYDARQETPGWSKPGFDDRKWEPAIQAEDNGRVKARFYEYQNPAPGEKPKIEGREVDLGFKAPPKLEAFPGVPVRVIEEIKPIALTSPTNDV
jgi:alpha-L-rhamnosidase